MRSLTLPHLNHTHASAQLTAVWQLNEVFKTVEIDQRERELVQETLADRDSTRHITEACCVDSGIIRWYFNMNHWALPDIKLSSGARQKHYLTMRRDITTRCYIHYTSKSHSAKHILFFTNTLLTGMMRLTQHSLFYKKFTTTLFIPQCICDKLLYFYISQKKQTTRQWICSVRMSDSLCTRLEPCKYMALVIKTQGLGARHTHKSCTVDRHFSPAATLQLPASRLLQPH